MPEVTLVDAVNLALARALADDPDVVVFGEDVGVNGGVSYRIRSRGPPEPAAITGRARQSKQQSPRQIHRYVVFLEPTRIYRSVKGEIEDTGEALPLDVAFVVREGHDVTLISWGAMVKDTLEAAEELAAEG
jgi:pyruvate/2-oxoglutarate/acetoin dehydrogenase E1 component